MDTRLILRFAVETWRAELRSNPPKVNSAFAPDADIYFIDVNFTAIEDVAAGISDEDSHDSAVDG